MLLDWLGGAMAASLIEDAVRRALDSRDVVVREDGCVEGGPRRAAERVIAHLGASE